MGIPPEQSANWPKSRKIEDAIGIRYAVVYEDAAGVHAEYCDGDEDEADARAVYHQRLGRKAWYVLLEGEGMGRHHER